MTKLNFTLLLLLLCRECESGAGVDSVINESAQAQNSPKLDLPPPQTPANETEPAYDVLTDSRWLPPDFESDDEEIDYYGPLDRFWRHSALTKTLMLGGVDYYSVIETCLNEELTEADWRDIRRPQELDRIPGTRMMDKLGAGPVFLVEIQNAMSPIHAKAVRALNFCVREHISQLYEKRPMYQVYQVEETADDSVKEQMGGNNPTHLNSLIGIFLPDVVNEQYETLRLAYHHAGWQGMVVRDEIMGKFRANDDGTKAAFAPSVSAGMRACEYLSYEGFNNLMEHQDGYATSVVLNVMLSDPEDYEGGEFYIQDKVWHRFCLSTHCTQRASILILCLTLLLLRPKTKGAR